MLYKLKDRDTFEEVAVYGVSKVEQQSYFLVFIEEKQDFAWVHSSYFAPIQ